MGRTEIPKCMPAFDRLCRYVHRPNNQDSDRTDRVKATSAIPDAETQASRQLQFFQSTRLGIEEKLHILQLPRWL